MEPLIILLAALTFISTIGGGLVAIKFRGFLQYFFAFASGALLGVTFFDILPESLNLAASANLPVRNLMVAIVAVFMFYSFLERFFLTHHHHDDEDHGHIMGPIGAGGLILHSLLDGAAIGIAFQVSSSVGITVALAVIFHDFTDGVNTVTIMLKNKHDVKHAKIFLLLDALAPIAGILLTSIVIISPSVLSLILAAFAGEFLYIGTANLLPETYKHTQWKMTVFMLIGVLLMFVLTAMI